MLRGLPASIIVHSAVFAMAYLGLPYFGFGARTYDPEVEVVDVDFVEIGAITNIAPIFSRPEPEPEEIEPEQPPEPEALPEELAEEDLPEADEDMTQNTMPEAAPDDPEDLMPDFDQTEDSVDEPVEEPEVEPEPKPQPPARQRPVDPLADFLNQSESTFKSEIETRKKRPEPQPVPAEPKDEPKLKDTPPPPRETRRAAGERSGNVARLESLIVSRIRNECWAGVDDLPNPERLNVQMRVLLNQNGTIADLRLVSPGRRPLGRSPMGTAVDRALRAVNKCAPYRLPSEDYADWQEMNVYLGLGFVKR